MPHESYQVLKTFVLPIEYTGTTGMFLRKASLAIPFLIKKATSSSLQPLTEPCLKIPAMPSATMPTQQPFATSRATELPDTSHAPHIAIYLNKGVRSTMDAGAPLKRHGVKAFSAGIERRFATGNTP